MKKIKLDHEDHKMNQRQVLQVINSSGISRKDLHFNFIKGEDKYYCIITFSDEERLSLSEELKRTSISYKNLKTKALS